MYPLAARDRLYRLFRECLSDPKAASAFDEILAEKNSHRDFCEDRIPRYRAVLAGYRGDGPLALAELLFNNGLFFDCHEHLEASWRAAEGPEKTAFQGFIQLAAAFHKLELDPKATAGALELLRKGLAKLHESGALETKAVARIASQLEPCQAAIASGRFDARDVPRLSLRARV